MSPPLAEMLAAPELLPHAIDETGTRLLLLQLDEATIREASFLDQRVVGAQPRGSWQALDDVIAAIDPAMPDDADYIFHLGHVGSTLVARLLGELGGVLALREPQILRRLSEIAAKGDPPDALWDPAIVEVRIAALRRLLARRFRPEQRTLVKATSFVSQIADRLLAPGARTLFLEVSLESYMRTILAGENSRAEAMLLAPQRLARLAKLVPEMPWRVWTMSEGEKVALGWLVETLSLERAAARMAGDAVLRVDFDRFLDDPAAGIMRMAGHLRLPLAEGEAARLAASPLMTRYSKAPEHEYSAQLRRNLQRQAGEEHRAAIAQGLAWIEACAARDASIAQATRRNASHVQAD
ncbi:hypothetical protein B2G71_13750 [Novosphingobium sp. PC22D]|uniref:hypothetical protein n=1 Tax=Novosphingobium sp. PC22D TaxID=1962403 RepID=UPI000BF1CF11|nr:hypothetical protein [Novosphingobium sp. PC22D]PEQ12191.1 hypothetical protein B2G71_13750 [Novosphingobium sp. PC22D]